MDNPTDNGMPSSSSGRKGNIRNKSKYRIKYNNLYYLRNDARIYETNSGDDPGRTPLQRKLFYFFEEPKSKKAQIFALFSTFCLVATLIIICLDSLPDFFIIKNVNVHLWLPFDFLIVLIFTIEYLGRCYAAVHKWKFVFGPSNLLNLFSIAPFYIQIFSPFSADSTLRFTRIIRLSRIINSLKRIGKFSDGFLIATNVFLMSAYQILLNLIYLIIVIVISATLMFYAERGDFDDDTKTWYITLINGTIEESTFQSIFHGFYWSMTTITTTGYGDLVPVTAIGKITAMLTALLGIMAIALTSAAIGINSDREWSKHQRHKTKVDFFDMWQAIDDKTINNLSRSEQTKRLQILEFQNTKLIDLLKEVQDKFNEIEPPMYILKHSKLKIEHNQTIERLSKLESEVKYYEKILGNYKL